MSKLPEGLTAGLAIKPLGIFGFYAETNHCMKVILSAFPHCQVYWDFVKTFQAMSELEQAGVYLYVGILVSSIWGIGFLAKKTFFPSHTKPST